MFQSAKLSKSRQYRTTFFHLFSLNNDIVVTLNKIISVRGGNKSKFADGTFTLKEIQGDGCLTVQIRMELCRQIEQGIDPLGGKSIEECLAAQPVEKVPVFRKKIKI